MYCEGGSCQNRLVVEEGGGISPEIKWGALKKKRKKGKGLLKKQCQGDLCDPNW